jgi:hypothetical protein
VHRAGKLTTFTCWLSWNLGASNSWNPKSLSWPVTGFLYLFTILYYNIVYCTTYIILYYTTLQFTIMYYTIVYFTSPYHTTLHYPILYHTILHYTTLHYPILHYTTLHYPILHYTTLHYTRGFWRWFMTFELRFLFCVTIFSTLFPKCMAPTNLTLIRFNCSANSHYLVTIVLKEASLKAEKQPVSNMMVLYQ